MGKKSFALHVDGRTIMKLERGHQEFLFEIRPETFSKCKVATTYWSFVELDHIDGEELQSLVLEAWSQIVPKKISRPVIEAIKQSNPAHPGESRGPS